jgi:hypothetical protein
MATIVKWPTVHSWLVPAIGFSLLTSTRTRMEVRPTEITRASTSTRSPTTIGTEKAMSSMAAVTTTVRERRMAAKPAALSIHDTNVPQKRLPRGLVSVGKTDSSRRASIGVPSVRGSARPASMVHPARVRPPARPAFPRSQAE